MYYILNSYEEKIIYKKMFSKCLSKFTKESFHLNKISVSKLKLINIYKTKKFHNRNSYNCISNKHIHKKIQSTTETTNAPSTQGKSLTTSQEAEESQDNDKISIIVTLFDDKLGILHEVLQIFAKNNINLSFINSKPSKFTSLVSKRVDFYIDIERPKSDTLLYKAIDGLKKYCENLEFYESEEVAWFPKSREDINLIAKQIKKVENEILKPDHPGYNDKEYLNRRIEIANISRNALIGKDYPDIKYSEEEIRVWTEMWDKLTPLHQKYACHEFIENFQTFINDNNLKRDHIPKLKDISNYIQKRTGFIFRPVARVLSLREFLNSLAFKVFSTMQYVRHQSTPLFSREPDIIHEILGHATMFANQDFCDYCQELGLASLGATDEELTRLGRIYEYTIEFGLFNQNGARKIYGGGILSSYQEIEWCMAIPENNNIKYDSDFNIEKIANFPFNPNKCQNVYFITPSFKKMKEVVIKYNNSIKRPFNVSYDVDSNRVLLDRKVNIKKL